MPHIFVTSITRTHSQSRIGRIGFISIAALDLSKQRKERPSDGKIPRAKVEQMKTGWTLDRRMRARARLHLKKKRERERDNGGDTGREDRIFYSSSESESISMTSSSRPLLGLLPPRRWPPPLPLPPNV